MKNSYYLITKEATKYWKKAIKKDRVMIANYGGSVYIVNGYNAFKLPANAYFWEKIARSAFMCDMPADNDAVEYRNGHGDITTVNTIYDCLVDFSHAEKIYCNSKISPVIATNEHGFTALLLPIRRPDDMGELVRGTFAGLLEG